MNGFESQLHHFLAYSLGFDLVMEHLLIPDFLTHRVIGRRSHVRHYM